MANFCSVQSIITAKLAGKKIMILMLNSEHNFPMTEKQQDLRMCKPTNGKVEFLKCDTQVINSEGLLLKHDILTSRR